ncbi:helix-turn-helix domain-containing protein [Leptolyngbya ohadii]|uniref:helix-turn-helix domain-containing protein n=1 Tax=Leptolyngbya ohadii TaxID=1962290 RepID=UPI000B59BF80|nr:helix-turn-helix domain-containing protein [Leptolyngbya ohadii]
MGDFDRKQLEQLNAIGEYLQHIRQDQGRSLDDISAKTYIPLRILRALEGGQGGILPEAVFVQGFIRRYADALGLDGMSLSRSFPVEREASSFDSSEQERMEPTQTLVETRLPTASRSDYSENRTASRRRGQSSFSLPLAIAGLLIAGGLVYGLSRLLFAPQRSSQTAATSVAPSPAPAAPTAPANAPKPPASPAAAPASSPAPAASPAAAPSPAARATNPPSSSAPVSVAMNVTADAWVQVTTDGRVVYEGILTKGTQRNWSAQQEMTIVSGNAGGVTLSHNRGAAKPMGAAGTVEEATFTARPGNSSGSSSTGNGAAPN